MHVVVSSDGNFFASVLKVFRKSSNTGSRYSHLDRMHFAIPDPSPVGAFFLRGRNASLIEVCPKFPGSEAPVVFHLPIRTALRIVENIPPAYISTCFVLNGKSRFGLNKAVVGQQLPRWRCQNDIGKASAVASALCGQLLSNTSWLPEPTLPGILRVVGDLSEARLISPAIANSVFKAVLPLCLEKHRFSRVDILDLMYGVSKLKIDSDNSILFPLVANFAAWFLERSKINRLNRSRRTLKERNALLMIQSPQGSTNRLVRS